MPDDLLAGARAQAERSEPPVRAAALLRIARVETAFDRGQARITFQQALDETRRLSGRDREFLLEQAQLLAAAVAPDLLREIPSVAREPRQFRSERLGRVMLDHEYGDAAYEYVIRYDEPSTFPFSVAASLMQWFGDEERRLAVFRRALEAWRAAPDHGFGNRFLSVFQLACKLLLEEEARQTAREIVRVTLSQPDWPITASYDQEQSVRITSGHDHTIFTILPILRRLDPPLVESLIGSHEQLAAAARRFPNGMESVMEEAQRKSLDRLLSLAAPNQSRDREGAASEPPARPTKSGGYGMAGSPRDFPYMRSLLQASEDGDFLPSIEHALEHYRSDAAPDHPNRAPREFWPSTCRFRGILYRAGKRLGRDAAVYLDRIPDDDLRLFAQIEFAAALAGLPELQGTQREYRPGTNKSAG
jgi:hypothetical protein